MDVSEENLLHLARADLDYVFLLAVTWLIQLRVGSDLSASVEWSYGR